MTVYVRHQSEKRNVLMIFKSIEYKSSLATCILGSTDAILRCSTLANCLKLALRICLLSTFRAYNSQNKHRQKTYTSLLCYQHNFYSFLPKLLFITLNDLMYSVGHTRQFLSRIVSWCLNLYMVN